MDGSRPISDESLATKTWDPLDPSGNSKNIAIANHRFYKLYHLLIAIVHGYVNLQEGTCLRCLRKFASCYPAIQTLETS